MDITSLYYFCEAAKDLNFTYTADRLFMTQQSISNHIARLEKHYDTLLFERKPKLSLTYSGRLLLDYAEKLLITENEVKNHIADIEGQKRGMLRVGMSIPRARMLLPDVLGIYSNEYPDVRIDLINSTSTRSEEMIMANELDVALGIFSGSNPSTLRSVILEDQIYLVVAESLLKKFYNPAHFYDNGAAREIRVEELIKLPVIMPNESSRMLANLQPCYSACRMRPNVYMTGVHPQLLFSLCTEGVAACFLPRSFLIQNIQELNGSVVEDAIHYFPLVCDSHPIQHKVSILQLKNKHLTNYTNRFIELCIACLMTKDSFVLDSSPIVNR